MDNLPAVASRSLTKLTTSSLAQRAKIARDLLAYPISATAALKAAKDLGGNFSSLRPDNPARFFEGVARILVEYPLGIVEECIDPRVGLASKIEFLSLHALKVWLDERLTFHQSLAAYVEPKPPIKRKLTQAELGQGAAAMRGLKIALTLGCAADLTFEKAVDLGRKSV
jgi:hypothetical protein